MPTDKVLYSDVCPYCGCGALNRHNTEPECPLCHKQLPMLHTYIQVMHLHRNLLRKSARSVLQRRNFR